MDRRHALVLCGLALACGSPPRRPVGGGEGGRPAPTPAAPTAPAPAADGTGLRLPRDFKIERYEIALTIDPALPTMTGAVSIAGALTRPTSTIWLHAEDMTFARATFVGRDGDVALSVMPGPARGRIALRADAPLPVGPATIAIEYTAKLQDTETEGTFRQKSGDDWYVFTQHEAISARRSFPCLDEPDLKVPWRLRLTVPATATAVANAPAELDVVAGGFRHVTFAPTEAIPSYLVAYAVGPFEYVDAGKSAHGVPMRIVTLRGRSKDAAFAAESTPRILAGLESWFGTPYPFAKLDSIAVPVTVGFGAMENPGLITYRETLLLIPEDAADRRREAYASVAAHELAHQWFGNLVTPVWWDDIWLNESFASWVPEKVLATLYPRWVRPEDAVTGRHNALDSDSLGTARAIRQPIVADDDIVTAFDGITYGKGAAVLRMVEDWVGADRFQAGVRAYLARHARGNATAADFIGAIAAQAPELAVPAVFASLLDQAGAPRLTVATECPDAGPARVTLAQGRFLALGATTGAAPTWTLPVCVRAEVGGKLVRACTLLTGGSGAVALAGCPAWVWPNADGRGYYRTTLDAAGWRAVRTRGWARLTASERLAAGQDVTAAVVAGDVGIDVALDLVPALTADQSRPMVTLAAKLVEGVVAWVPAQRRPAFAAWTARQFGPLARKLGWVPRVGEGSDVERLRSAVVPLAADVGGDKALRKTAVAKMRAWWTLPEAVRGDVVWVAMRAKPALHEALMVAFKNEQDRTLRAEMARALGIVATPARLEAAFALTLDPTVDIRFALPILQAAAGRHDTRAAAEAYVVAHLDELIARLPGDSSLGLIAVLAASCDPARQVPMRELVVAKLGTKRGAQRRIDQAFERMNQCVTRRAADEPVLVRWLAKLPKR